MTEYVKVKGKNCWVTKGKLNLFMKKIKNISDIEGLEKITNLTELELGDNQLTNIEGIEKFTNLTKLGLSGNNLTKIEGLEKFTKLKDLNLAGNKFIKIEGLDTLTNLSKLVLNRNKFSKIEGLDKLTNLESLYLRYNDITRIEGLETLIKLTKLTISKKKLTNIGGLDIKNAQAVVKFCQDMKNYNIEKKRKGKERIERERIEKEQLKKKRIEKERLEEEKLEKKRFEWERKEIQRKEKERLEEERIEKERLEEERIENERLEEERIEKERLEEERIEKQRIEKEKRELKEKIKNDTFELIKKSSVIYKSLDFDKITDKIDIDINELEDIIGDMIYTNVISGHIEGNSVIFDMSVLSNNHLPVHPSSFIPNNIEILRGGDWKVEGGQSVFFYKVKVKNNSNFVVSNINVIITSFPSGTELDRKHYTIASLKPKSYESPTFKLIAQESCVGDTIEGIVTYIDPSGNQQSVHIEPFSISYVCNLLTPKVVSRLEFEQKTQFMEENKLIIESIFKPSILGEILTKKFDECNFARLDDIKEIQSENFLKLEGFAQGLYDKQDVAMSVAVQKMDKGSKIVVKALSDRSEKVTDILRDFNCKLDDIKSDTELFKQYGTQLELILEEQNNLEYFLREHLSSDWEKVSAAYKEMQSGIITKREFIGKSAKILVNKLIKKAID